MERYLSIVLDERCQVSKTLLKDEAYALDNYIYRNFNSSEDIRKKYSNEINEFLSENSNIIESIEKKTNKTYRGSIVILEVLEDGSLKRVKVIYKDNIKKLRKEYITNQILMKEFIYKNRKYFSDFVYERTRGNLSKSFYENIINEWFRQIHDSVHFYDVSRLIIKYFENKLKGLSKNIPDIKENTTINQNNSDYNIDLYDGEYDPDLDFHPDLDEIASGKYNEDYEFFLEPENEEIEEVKVKTKVKKKDKNILGQTSLF